MPNGKARESTAPRPFRPWELDDAPTPPPVQAEDDEDGASNSSESSEFSRVAFVDGQFPQDLYQLIFLLLSGPDLLAAALANPAWWHIIRSNELWAKKAAQLWPGLVSRSARFRFDEAPASRPYRWGPDHAHADFPHLLLPHRSWCRYVLERSLAEEAGLALAGGPPPDSLRALPFTGPFLGALAADFAPVWRAGARLPNLRHAAFTNMLRAPAGPLLAALADGGGFVGPRLASLALCDEALAPPDLPLLPRLVAARPALTALDLTRNGLRLDGARALAAALEAGGGLARLQLASNDVGDEGALVLAAALARSAAVTELGLAHNGITAAGAAALADVLRGPNPDAPHDGVVPRVAPEGPQGAAASLRTLDLSNNPIGREGALALAAALATNHTLARLSLRYCGLLGNSQENIAGGKIPLPALLAGRALTSLDLSYNDVVSTAYDRPEAILDALEGAPRLLSLNLQRSSIGGWRRALAIGRALARTSSLTAVDLSCNWIGSGSSAAAGDILLEYAAAFRASRTLRSVGFAHNDVRAAGARLLVEAAAAGGTIEYLDLQRNAIGREGVAALVRLMEATTASAASGRCCRGMRPLVPHPLFDGVGDEPPPHPFDVPVPRFERCSCGRAPLQVNLCGNTSIGELLAAPRRPRPGTPLAAPRDSPLPALPDGPRPAPRPAEDGADGAGPLAYTPLPRPLSARCESAPSLPRLAALRGSEPASPPPSGPPSPSFKRRRTGPEAAGAGRPLPPPTEPVSVVLHDAHARRRLPSPSFMGADHARGINAHCRAILLDWLAELCEAFGLPDEALCRAAHYTDLYTSRVPVSRSAYQLVGAVALMLATSNFFSKLGMTDRTVQAPSRTILPRDIVYYSDDSYSQGEVTALEASMLQLLRFELEHHGPFCYLAAQLAALGPPPAPAPPPAPSPAPRGASPWPTTPPPPSPSPPPAPAASVAPEVAACAGTVEAAGAGPGPAAAPPIDDLVASLAAEVVRACVREYGALRLHPSLVAAGALYLALRHAGLPWGEGLAAAAGYTERYLAAVCDEAFGFLRGRELRCPSLLDREGHAPQPAANPPQPAPLALGAGAAFGTAAGGAVPAAGAAGARPKYTVVL